MIDLKKLEENFDYEYYTKLTAAILNIAKSDERFFGDIVSYSEWIKSNSKNIDSSFEKEVEIVFAINLCNFCLRNKNIIDKINETFAHFENVPLLEEKND